VVLEALASGTPVVATRVWGTPELLPDPGLGILVDGVDEASLGAALGEALRRPWDREAIAAHGRRFRWDATAAAIESALAGLGEGSAAR